MENSIDLRRLLALLRQHIWGIIITTVVCGAAGLILAAFVIPPKYEATTQILVNQKHGNDNGQAYNNQQADIQMINTYKDIITNPVILNEASRELRNPQQLVRPARKAKYVRNADGTKHLIRAAKPAVYKRTGTAYNVNTGKLKKYLSVQTQQNSQVFTLVARTGDPAESAQVANTVARVFKQRIGKMMSISNVTIVSHAIAPKGKAFPSNKLFLLGGAVLGLLCSIIWIVLRDAFDTTVKDDSFLTEELGLSDLGQIAHYHMEGDNNLDHGQETRLHRRV